MSAATQPNNATDRQHNALTDEQVINFLRANPTFFQQHPDLLTLLHWRYDEHNYSLNLAEFHINSLSGELHVARDALAQCRTLMAQQNEFNAALHAAIAAVLSLSLSTIDEILATINTAIDGTGMQVYYADEHAAIWYRYLNGQSVYAGDLTEADAACLPAAGITSVALAIVGESDFLFLTHTRADFFAQPELNVSLLDCLALAVARSCSNN